MAVCEAVLQAELTCAVCTTSSHTRGTAQYCICYLHLPDLRASKSTIPMITAIPPTPTATISVGSWPTGVVSVVGVVVVVVVAVTVVPVVVVVAVVVVVVVTGSATMTKTTSLAVFPDP